MKSLLVSLSLLWVQQALICTAIAADQPQADNAKSTDAQSTNSAADARSGDEAAIRASGQAFIDAYNARDAKKLAALWSPDAVYIDPLTSEQTVGRDEIEKVFEDAFSDKQDAKLGGGFGQGNRPGDNRPGIGDNRPGNNRPGDNRPGIEDNRPGYYNYGDNVCYQGDTVYYGDQPVCTADEYTQQAEAIATSIPPDVQPAAEDWLPLGVFAITQDGQSADDESTMFLQLAVSKQGIITGMLQNTASGSTKTVEGMVDKETQRAAWTAEGETRPLMKTGISNLTQDTAGVLVHFENGETQRWLLARLNDPTKSAAKK
jgi:hypothetical protein